MDKTYSYRNGDKATILTIFRPVKFFPVIAMDKFGYITTHTADGKSDNPDLNLIEDNRYKDFKINDPVLVKMNDTKVWYRRHFAGADVNGKPKTFVSGFTDWTSKEGFTTTWDKCIRPSDVNPDEPIQS